MMRKPRFIPMEGLAITSEEVSSKLLVFFADRLKVVLKERGVRHDLVDAVFALGGEDDLVRLLSRVQALQDFLATDDGANLLIAYRRAANILRIEEKKDGVTYDGAPDAALSVGGPGAGAGACVGDSRRGRRSTYSSGGFRRRDGQICRRCARSWMHFSTR